jgi:hypothetical protein
MSDDTGNTMAECVAQSDTDGTTMTATPEQDPMPNQTEETEDLARRLEATGDYRILRRLVPRAPTPTPAGYSGKIGIVLDFETTGLDRMAGLGHGMSMLTKTNVAPN